MATLLDQQTKLSTPSKSLSQTELYLRITKTSPENAAGVLPVPGFPSLSVAREEAIPAHFAATISDKCVASELNSTPRFLNCLSPNFD
ncbi:hypothetical protein TSUD_122260 [Trifolium subterraneum]|nr:hypothetical protein TSUD_122260 [Trifolium subterraneum]